MLLRFRLLKKVVVVGKSPQKTTLLNAPPPPPPQSGVLLLLKGSLKDFLGAFVRVFFGGIIYVEKSEKGQHDFV
jgi:hypothetical protein